MKHNNENKDTISSVHFIWLVCFHLPIDNYMIQRAHGCDGLSTLKQFTITK